MDTGTAARRGWLGALAGPGLLMVLLVPVRAVFRFTMPLAEGEP